MGSCEVVLQSCEKGTCRFANHRKGCLDVKISLVNGQDRIFVNLRAYLLGSQRPCRNGIH